LHHLGRTPVHTSEEIPMLVDTPSFTATATTPRLACEHCAGLIRHESWCITRNGYVFHASEVVFDPAKLHLTDRLILHALGVKWMPCECWTM
jgi:hypothetical protein